MEMERWRKLRLLTSSFVLSLGFLAATFSFVSEITRVRADQVLVIVGGDDDDDYCVYPSSSSSSTWEMDLVAAASLVMSQLIANIIACGGCIYNSYDYYCKSSRKMRTMAILCLVLSWISFGNAIFLLLEGLAVNGRQLNLIGQGGIHGCYVVKAGVYGVAGILCMFTCGLSTMYYWITTSTTTTIAWEAQRDDYEDDESDVGGKNGHLPGPPPPPPLVAHVAPILCFNPSACPPIPYTARFEELPKRYSHFFQL